MIAYLETYIDVFSCVGRRFINDLPHKSDKMAHIVFPDERYKQPELTAYAEMEEMHCVCK